jgi:hypothetical protein
MLQAPILRSLSDDPWGDPLSLAQAAVALDCGEAQVQNYIADGKLRGARFEDGRVISISRVSVRRFLGLP